MNSEGCIFCDKKHSKEWVQSMEFRKKHNLWDDSDVVFETIDKSRKHEWTWVQNWNCKYIDVRIDMRSGKCIIKDKEGNRISPNQLRYQYSDSTPEKIPDSEAYKEKEQ